MDGGDGGLTTRVEIEENGRILKTDIYQQQLRNRNKEVDFPQDEDSLPKVLRNSPLVRNTPHRAPPQEEEDDDDESQELPPRKPGRVHVQYVPPASQPRGPLQSGEARQKTAGSRRTR